MTIQSVFLGFDQPALVSAAEYLLRQFAHGGVADLRQVVVVMPSGRAARRLLEILVDQCEAKELVLTPPEISTVGQFPELLYRAKLPFADDLTQQLTWADVLRRFDRDRLKAVVAQPPDSEDAPRWEELGRLLQTLHRELASDVLDFADVAEKGNELDGFTELRRWQVLAELQSAYLARLDELMLWDRQTARRYAIQHDECQFDRPIVLVGTVDLNQAMRRMLDEVVRRSPPAEQFGGKRKSQQHSRVVSLIFAPAEWSERFDQHGWLLPDAWQTAELDIPEAMVQQADDPVDQADAVARRIAGLGGRYRAEQITIGMPDERIIPQLVRQLDECGVPNRYGPGQSLASASVYRLWKDLADFLEFGRYSQFAALVRHPDLEAWLLRAGVKPGWLEALDNYYSQHLPSRLDGAWLGEPERCELIRQVHRQLETLTVKLSGPPRPLAEWLQPLGRLVLEVYGPRQFNLEDQADRTTWKACNAVQDVLGRLVQLPAPIMPVGSAAAAIRLVLDQLGSLRIAPLAAEAAVELVGWLELPLDDAPALIVTSFNEGFVPSSVNADLFLPGALRTALGIDDNARRYARDAYAVSTLLAPWRETTLIVGRRDAEDDPLAPSRLLFAAPSAMIASRALRFFSPPAPRPPRGKLAGGLTAARRDFAFEVPRPVALPAPLDRLRVTAFAAYLACPYRFYLNHVLRHRAANDDALELDGAAFGNLAHEVLERFAVSDERDSHDAEAIRTCGRHLLQQQVRLQYGKHPGPAVRIQVEQLAMRLDAWSRWQADRVREGWRIEHVELSFSETRAEMLVDGQPMLLTGRIDRIDINEHTGRRQILDYKTSDGGLKPEKTHRRRGNWIELQLPLYRHLARTLGIDAAVELGYVLLPKSSADVGLALADWTDAELDEADEVAYDVIRRIRREEFWPPTDPAPQYSEDHAFICMDGVFGRPKLSVD